MIVIVDYELGNLFSVCNAFKLLGVEAVISSKPDDIKNAERLVLPGGGAFGDGMNNLKAKIVALPQRRDIKQAVNKPKLVSGYTQISGLLFYYEQPTNKKIIFWANLSGSEIISLTALSPCIASLQ